MNRIRQKLEKAEKKAHLLDETEKLIPQYKIAVRLDKIEDFYNKFAVRNQDNFSLNPEIETYLIDSLENQIKLSHLNVDFYFSELTIDTLKQENFCKQLNFYFGKQAEKQLEHNHSVFKRWVRNLLFGLVFLALLLVLAHICNTYSDQFPFFNVLGESFSIIGWVALWEPATYFLYGWRQDAKTLRNFMQLHRAHFSLLKETEG